VFGSARDAQDNHAALAIVDGVDHAPGPETDAMKISIELFDTHGPGVGAKGSDGVVDRLKGIVGDTVKFTLGPPLE